MAQFRQSGVESRGRRRWAFAGCQFDEPNWSLIVDGKRVPVESKPLELLRELLLRPGDVVSKDELLDTIWPDVVVVEASLPTAVGKLRRALGDERRDLPIIETVSRIGYRLGVPVELVESSDASSGGSVSAPHPSNGGDGPKDEGLADRSVALRRRRPMVIVGMLALAALALPLGLYALEKPMTAAPQTFNKADVFTALRKTDVEAIERMLAAGWDPNAPLDIDRNGAVNILLGNCEWDRGHDQRRLLLATRTLFDGGARVIDRNAWGDTAYSIAKAERYCGPDHPVTKLIHMMCYEGGNPVGDRCLADYRRDPSGKVLRQ